MRIGIDVVEISEIKKKSKDFFERTFTEKELEFIKNSGEQVEKHYAGFLASKDAVIKALGVGLDKISQKEIELFHTKDGKPFVKLSGEARQVFDELFFSHIEISISHSTNYAVANCVIY